MDPDQAPGISRPPAAEGGFGSFVSRASHDLRAPIRHIGLLVDWLIEDHAAELSPGALEKLGDLGRCARRLEGLVDGLTEYLRLDAEDPPRARVDAGRLVAEVIAGVIAGSGPAPGISITVEGVLPDFPGVPERMARVFSVLIGNALRHHGSAAGRVVVSGFATAGECTFRVRDDGPGIAPQFREAVFAPFRTLRTRDEAEGSGMGLAIARRIVEQHGGRIWVEDGAEARGACFGFTVPLRGDLGGVDGFHAN